MPDYYTGLKREGDPLIRPPEKGGSPAPQTLEQELAAIEANRRSKANPTGTSNSQTDIALRNARLAAGQGNAQDLATQEWQANEAAWRKKQAAMTSFQGVQPAPSNYVAPTIGIPSDKPSGTVTSQDQSSYENIRRLTGQSVPPPQPPPVQQPSPIPISAGGATGGTPFSQPQPLPQSMAPLDPQGMSIGVGMEQPSKALETWERIAQKADVEARLAAGDLPQSIDPNQPLPTQEQEPFLFPSAEEGAERREQTFGTESKIATTAAVGGIAAAAIAAPWIVAAATANTVKTAALSQVGKAIPTITNIVKTGAGRVASNTATTKMTTKALSKLFSTKVMGAAGAWAGAVFLGKWGQAESPEPLSITINTQLIPEAQRTGDWTQVEDAQAAKQELLDLNTWEQIGLWSPISPFIGIPRKIMGAALASIIQDNIIEEMKTTQATEGTAKEQQEAKNAKFNSDRIMTEKTIQGLRELAKNETSKTDEQLLKATIKEWEDYAKRKQEQESIFNMAERQATADFWANN